MNSFAPWCDCILCFRVIYEFMSAKLISSKKMQLGWESVWVSRSWSVPEASPSQGLAPSRKWLEIVLLLLFQGTFFLAPYNSLYFQSFSSQQAFLPCSFMFKAMMLWKICLAFSSALSPPHSPLMLPLQLTYLTLCLAIHKQYFTSHIIYQNLLRHAMPSNF